MNVAIGSAAGAAILGSVLLLCGPIAPVVSVADAGAKTESEDVVAPRGKIDLVDFEFSPFPYRKEDPSQGKPFLDVNLNNRLGHTSARGGIYWEDETYSDRRSLLFIPEGFAIDRPGTIVVFFHGNQSTLSRDVIGRLQVPRQVAESGLNAVLVAPQFAVNAMDSSPGHFWEPGAFRRYIKEAGTHLAKLYGAQEVSDLFDGMPVILVAYSGGYLAAAFAVNSGDADKRLAGLILLDSLYGQVDKFADWIAYHSSTSFFFSAYSKSSDDYNTALQALLSKRGVGVALGLPTSLGRGSVSFLRVSDDVVHDDFVSSAWTTDPLKSLLAKVPEVRVASERAEPAVIRESSHKLASRTSESPRPSAALGDSRKESSASPEKLPGAITEGPLAAGSRTNQVSATQSLAFGTYLIAVGASGLILTLILIFFFTLAPSRRSR